MKLPPLPPALRALASRVKPYLLPLAVSSLLALLAIRAILHDAGRPAMPLDDSFIHFVYARRFAEGHPFTFGLADGYSSGATSFAWPLLLTPFYVVGLRGLSLVWAVWLIGTLLHAAVALETKRLVEGLAGKAAAVGAAAMCLLFGAFTWFAWSGMETIALAWAMTRSARVLSEHCERPAAERTMRRALSVAAMCGLCALVRPEGGLFAGAGALILGLARPQQKSRSAAILGRLPALIPIAAVAWVPLLNIAMVGHARSTTAIVKWAFGNPYYDRARFLQFFGQTVHMLWADLLSGGPYTAIFLPEHSQYVFLAGAVALVPTAMRSRRVPRGLLVALLALGTLIPCTFLTILWNRVRYIWPFAPGWFALVACLGAELAALAKPYLKETAWVPALVTGMFAGALATKLTWTINDLANSSRAISEQQVKLGMWANENLPADAIIGVNDTGAIAYFSNRRTFDVVGLTTEGEARYWVAGTGSRYEHYERLAPEKRPTHFIVYPQWMGTPAILGERLFEATVLDQSILGGATKVAYVADWDVLGRADEPEADTLGSSRGTAIDVLDVSDLESEADHRYRLGPANDTDNVLFNDWDEQGRQLVDGGRKQRWRDDFTMTFVSGSSLVGRFSVEAPTAVTVLVDDVQQAAIEIPASSWTEIEIPLGDVAPGQRRVTVQASDGKLFASLHYWVFGK